MAKALPIIIAVVGIILLAGGASSYIAKSSSTVACEACGMEIEKEDISTIGLVSPEETHWACCPVCAMVMGLHYESGTLQTRCFGCGESITIEFNGGNITAIAPSDGNYNITMLFGMACMKNKIICSNGCADQVRTDYDWATGLPTKTMTQTHNIAEMKYSQFTVGYKQIEIPMIAYGLIIGGIILLAIAPLEWFFIEKERLA